MFPFRKRFEELRVRQRWGFEGQPDALRRSAKDSVNEIARYVMRLPPAKQETREKQLSPRDRRKPTEALQGRGIAAAKRRSDGR